MRSLGRGTFGRAWSFCWLTEMEEDENVMVMVLKVVFMAV
jgi:hypothetical protein